MLKTRKRWICLLITLTFLLSLLPMGVASAGASSYTTVTKIPKFDPSTSAAGNVKSALVQVKLDPAVSEESTAWAEVRDANGDLLDVNDVDYVSSVGVSTYGLDVASDNSRIELALTPAADADEATICFYVYFDGKDSAAGDVKLSFFNTSGQLDSGDVVIAKATGGEVQVAVAGSVPTIGEDIPGTVKLRLTQTVSGALKPGADPSVKVKLPSGFEWADPESNSAIVTPDVDEDSPRLLNIYVSGTAPGIVDITAKVAVADADVAKMGDVEATIEGGNDTTVTPSEIVVAKYAEYGVKVSVASEKELLAGKLDQKTDKITIEEKVAGSLIDGRRVTVKLPSWVKIQDVTDRSTEPSFTPSIDDNRFSFVVPASTGKAKYEFKLKLSIEAGRSGDIEATISGAGIPETKVAIAKAVPAISASADPVNVKVGVQSQAVGDLTITEAKAGAIESGDTSVDVILPVGVRFSSTPKVEVTEGDLEIESDAVTVRDYLDVGDKRVLEIPVKAESLEASTIKVSGIKLTLDRTVPEGDLLAKIGGGAVVENAGIDDYGFTTDTAAEVKLATVVTRAPDETKGTAVFKIGEAKYTVNGEEKTMDVAAYTKDGRTFLPVRFAANAVGVSDANILWDGATQKVTIFKGDRVVQMTIGSKVLVVNGVSINMDVAPETVSGRTVLPIRFLAQALGADIQWNPETQEVTINF